MRPKRIDIWTMLCVTEKNDKRSRFISFFWVIEPNKKVLKIKQSNKTMKQKKNIYSCIKYFDAAVNDF